MNKTLSFLLWGCVALAGAFAVGVIAVHRGEPISALWLVMAAACCYALGYRFYSSFIATKLLMLDPQRATPAERLENGRDYLVTNKWVVFGHHFAAIAGPGPLVGPVLAAQFGYLPGTLWILAGAVLAGCVQDFVILLFSVRRDGKSLTEMAKEETGKVGGFVAYAAVIVILIVLLAVVALIVVNALKVEPMGNVHHRDDHSHRVADGDLSAQNPSGKSAGSFGPRIHAGDAGDCRRAVGFAEPKLGGHLYPQRVDSGDADHRLRLRSVGVAGVAVAGSARLSQHICEAGNDFSAGHRHCVCSGPRCTCPR